MSSPTVSVPRLLSVTLSAVALALATPEPSPPACRAAAGLAQMARPHEGAPGNRRSTCCTTILPPRDRIDLAAPAATEIPIRRPTPSGARLAHGHLLAITDADYEFEVTRAVYKTDHVYVRRGPTGESRGGPIGGRVQTDPAQRQSLNERSRIDGDPHLYPARAHLGSWVAACAAATARPPLPPSSTMRCSSSTSTRD